MVSGQIGVHTAAVQQLVVLELKLELEPVLIQVLHSKKHRIPPSRYIYAVLFK